MNERDVRLLFEAGHWDGANVIRDAEQKGWRVLLLAKREINPSQVLSSKRGSSRIFKTSDAALQWCKEIGFQDITIQFNTLDPGKKLHKSSTTVLLIEDNPDDILLTQRAFNKSKLEITLDIVRNGQDALDYIFAKNNYAHRNDDALPRLILLDINLPKLSGLEVLKQLRADERTKYIPIVLLTTSDEFCDVVEGYQLGSNSYIKKPIDFSIFSEVIQNLGEYWLNVNTPHPSLLKPI